MKSVLILISLLLLLINFAASQNPCSQCSDNALLACLGVSESCTNSSSTRNIITCDTSNKLTAVNIPAGWSFPYPTRVGNIKLTCVTKLQIFSIASPTTNMLTGNFNNDLPNSLVVFRVNYQNITNFNVLRNSNYGGSYSNNYNNFYWYGNYYNWGNTANYALATIEIQFNSIPLDFSDVSQFKYANLKTLNLKGSINCYNYNPGDSFKCFPDDIVPSVTTLDLGNNGLVSVPTNIFALSNLNTLILSNNRIVGTLSLFPSLSNLNYLDISNNSFNGLIPNMPNLITFIYNNNNFDQGTGFFGTIKSIGIQIGSSSSSGTNLQQIGAIDVTATNGFGAQLSLTGQPFSGLNSNGIKFLIGNYSGTSTVILAQNANNFETDFAVYGGSATGPASFFIGGGATLFGRSEPRLCAYFDQNGDPVFPFGETMIPNFKQIIFGNSNDNSICRNIKHSAIYPAVDSFGTLGTAGQRWAKVFAVSIFGDVVGTVSDIRVKENIVPFTDVLEKVKQLHAYSYNLKESYSRIRNGKKTIGLISQQVQKVFPELVHEVNDHLLVEYQKFVPILVEASKELADNQDELQAANKELREKVEAQEKKIDQLMELVTKLSSTVSTLSTAVQEQNKVIQNLMNSPN